jgi:hypothetical protein
MRLGWFRQPENSLTSGLAKPIIYAIVGSRNTFEETAVDWAPTMNIYRTGGLLLVAAILLVSPSITLGITLGQVDTFESGIAGWNYSALTTLPGGPAGSNDHYLAVYGGLGSSNFRIEPGNAIQWSGNYVAAGVTAITMDLKNDSDVTRTQPLFIRVVVFEGVSPAGYCSTTAFSLPHDGQWHHAVFPLTADSMTGINQAEPLSIDLQSVFTFSIINSVSPALGGDNTPAVLDIDNITAEPEPAPIVLAVIGLLAIWSRLTFERKAADQKPQLHVGSTAHALPLHHSRLALAHRGRGVGGRVVVGSSTTYF